MKKRTADESQVSVLLKDFEDADMLMAKVCTVFGNSSIEATFHSTPNLLEEK